MNIFCVRTGSSGNCYLLNSGNETLILDCGISIRKIKKTLNWDISRVVAVLCSHSHSDHSKSVKDFENMGIEVWKPYIEYAGFTSQRIYHKVFGKFSIKCFPLPHNGTDNFGFLIEVVGQKILYMTDYEYCRFNFKSLQVNHILCECNYQKELVERDLPNYEHKIRGHCSLDTCKSFIETNKTSALRTVILCHMGAETTIAEECLAEVQNVTGEGVNVVVARKGLEVELIESRCPL